MKTLFFYAAAGNPKVAPALEGQTWNTLRPFNRFITQAIHTAKQRQFRYQLPWEPVRNLRTFRLEPVDSILRVPRRIPGVILTNWPTDKNPDFSQPGFVTNRAVPVQFESATLTDQGLLVITEPSLLPTDHLIWCEQHCTVMQEPLPPLPRDIYTLDGEPLELFSITKEDGDQYWLINVKGRFTKALDLIVDNISITAEPYLSSETLRKVLDETGRTIDVSNGILRTEDPPASDLLRGDNGIRYRWREFGSTGRQGNWVQLLPPESSEGDDFLDPRAAFCEGDVTEIWTQPKHRRDTTFRVKRIDQDRYQLLLDRFPDEGTTLYLPVEHRNLFLQKRALRQLSESPLPHHQGLLRLCEDPQYVRWPKVRLIADQNEKWNYLTDESRSGTSEQRVFVRKALASPDFAFLEGPPGSGKTTAICEIVQQLVEKGQRVLLCGSTHVAIDNVLERLLDANSPIDAIRIGKIDKVDDKVQATQLDKRIEDLVVNWRSQPSMYEKSQSELEEMAERTVIMAANLTCGTTMGIVNHPLFRRQKGGRNTDAPISTMPHWDVLIVDEASKTLIQEFMVPALMAKRWIIVGDVRQLPPFADRAYIIANLRDLVDEDNKSIFPPDHQRACLMLFRLLQRKIRQTGARWLLVEKPGVLEWVTSELESSPQSELSVVRVAHHGGQTEGAVKHVTVQQLQTGSIESLHIAAADWVMVSDDLLPMISDLLPSNLLFANELSSGVGSLSEGDPLFLRQSWWLTRATALQKPYRERKNRHDEISTLTDCQSCETDWLGRTDLAQELAWRITRFHELRHSRNDRERRRLRDDLSALQPKFSQTKVKESLEEIEDIGLPSILEVLQNGIGVERSRRRSALTGGLRSGNKDAFESRFETLSYQHRMHSEIASFPREVIYEGHSLKDANTIQFRDEQLGWNFGSFQSRRVWANVVGRDQRGENPDEVRKIESILKEFIAWAKEKGPPDRDTPKVWEVACLCFYVKQEQAMSKMLQKLTRDDRRTRFQVHDAPVEIVCGTVDRFQGREADLVMLSMRNTNRVGFLDSPNRLNVAVTRAKQQLVVVGNANYFSRCGISELEALVRLSPQVGDHEVYRRRSNER